MTPLMRNLTLLLIAQLLLALWLFSSSNDDIETRPLLPQLNAADSLLLSSKDGELALTKHGDNWQLTGGLPVSQSKLDNLLRDLTALKTGWPVAQSAEAQSRFSVAEDKFEQKLVLKQGEKALHTLYLGDSPAFRQLYLRTDGDDAIYKAALNRFELSLDESAWLDKQILRLPVVERITQGDNSLSRQGDDWQLSLNGESHSADSAAADGCAGSQRTVMQGNTGFTRLAGESDDADQPATVRCADSAAKHAAVADGHGPTPKVGN